MMKFFDPAPLRRRLRPFCLAACCLALAPFGSAQTTLTWTNVSGSVTLYGSGARATSLSTEATLSDSHVTDSLNYLDATSAPVISRSDAQVDAASFSSLAQLAVNESEDTGMPFVSGSIDFTSADGGGIGSGAGAITLYFLISVPNPAKIELTNVRSALAATGASSSAFALNLYQSDAGGAKVGGSLVAYAGNYFDAGTTYQTSAPYYLLEMNVSARQASSASAGAEFSYFVDLQPIAAVPEPSSTALVLAAIIIAAAVRRSCSRRRVRP